MLGQWLFFSVFHDDHRGRGEDGGMLTGQQIQSFGVGLRVFIGRVEEDHIEDTRSFDESAEKVRDTAVFDGIAAADF